MSTESRRALTSSPRRDARIAVIAALSVERARFGRANRGGVEFLQSGPGAARAEAAARAAISAGAGALVSWGLAGALVEDAAPGDVVVPASVAVAGGDVWRADPRWHAALAAALTSFTVHTGMLLGVPAVVASPAGKQAAARAWGAVAADMESAAIAASAAAAGVPFAVVRVVADGSADALPEDIEQWVDAAGDSRLLPLIGAAATPKRWRTLIMLAARYRLARRTLDGAARCLLARDFCRASIDALARAH